MEDLSDVLRKSFFAKYKKKPDLFGTVENRVTKMNEQRKTNRHDVVFEKRKIPANMSPVVTPGLKRGKMQELLVVKEVKEAVPNKRLEMLAKWKAEKEKQKKLSKKSDKPVFKVSHVPVNIGLPNLENVNKEIKGKFFVSKFAPTNHKFKPPANIKPLNIYTSNNITRTASVNEGPRRMVTRSQTRTASISDFTLEAKKKTDKAKKATPKIRRKSKSEKNKENEPKTEKTVEKITDKDDLDSSISSPDYPVTSNNNSSENEDNNITPRKVDPPVYISPFVTISRGKDSARKEYEARKKGVSFPAKPDTPDYTSPKAGAAYFTWLLNNQIARLQGVCDQWHNYKTEVNPPEEAVSMIDVAIGQTNLLITKKFQQFRELIDKCDNEHSETRVTCEDLHGFWDMIYLQVVNLDKRFENLNNLKDNNWEEILPEVKKVTVKKKDMPIKKVKASLGLKAAIQAARKKKQIEKASDVVLEVLQESKTPQKRRSSRLLTVTTSESKPRNSSPGLIMMKIAQYAKGVETPAKSILKNESVKSNQKSKSKTVLFQDEISIDNGVNQLEMQSKAKTPTRRSTRKLF